MLELAVARERLEATALGAYQRFLGGFRAHYPTCRVRGGEGREGGRGARALGAYQRFLGGFRAHYPTCRVRGARA